MSDENKENLEEKVETTETVETTEQVSTDLPYYKQFGEYETEDAFKADFEEGKSLKSMRSDLENKNKEIEERLSILMEVDNEVDVELETIASLKKKGLDLYTATKLMSSTEEEFIENPLSALILAEQVGNPAKFKKLGRETVELALREKYGLHEEGEYTPTPMMKSDALDAIDKINEVKKNVGDIKNPYKFAQEEKQNRAKQFEERQNVAVSKANAFVKDLKEVAYTYDKESSISLQVSKEEIDSVLNSQSAKYLGHLFDPSTKEGETQLKSWVTNQILSQKFQTGEIGKQIVNSLSAENKKQAIKEVHNGEAVVPNRNGKTPVDGKTLTAVQKQLIAEGKTPITMQQS